MPENRFLTFVLRQSWSSLFKKLGLAYIMVFFLSFLIIINMYHMNIFEYARTLPFSSFTYPLEVDLREIVNKVLKNEPSGVEPLNNPYSYPYVINSDSKCKDEEGQPEEVFLLLLIKSRIENFEERHTIRRTWGREHQVLSGVPIRRIFLVGINPDDKSLQHRLGLEHQDYNDIVQQYFEDTYFNNTLKMIMGFQWALHFCHTAQFIAFFDDDYFVNTKNLVNLLKSVPSSDYGNLTIGYIWKNAMPNRILTSKWYISIEEYPFRFWPNYVTAGSFFVHMDTAKKLYAGMQYTRMIRFDDVFLGIVSYKLGVRLQHNENLHFHELPYDKFAFQKVIAAHGYKDMHQLLQIWREQDSLDKLSQRQFRKF